MLQSLSLSDVAVGDQPMSWCACHLLVLMVTMVKAAALRLMLRGRAECLHRYQPCFRLNCCQFKCLMCGALWCG